MRIRIERSGDIIEEGFHGTARQLLAHLGIPPETVLIVKDGTLITEDDSVDDATEIELLSVVSGG